MDRIRKDPWRVGDSEGAAMSSRLILKWDIDGDTVRHVRMWIPEGERGVRLFDLAHKLVGVLVGIKDVTYTEGDK